MCEETGYFNVDLTSEGIKPLFKGLGKKLKFFSGIIKEMQAEAYRILNSFLPLS